MKALSPLGSWSTRVNETKYR